MNALKDSGYLKSIEILGDIVSLNRHYDIEDYLYDIYINNEVWLMTLYTIAVL